MRIVRGVDRATVFRLFKSLPRGQYIFCNDELPHVSQHGRISPEIRHSNSVMGKFHGDEYTRVANGLIGTD